MSQEEILLNALPCGCLKFNDKGIIDFANDTLYEILGYPVGTLKSTNFENILTISSRIFYQTHFFPLLKLGGKADEIFLTLKAADNVRVPVMMNGKTMIIDNEVSNLLVVVTVWERQKHEAERILLPKNIDPSKDENSFIELTKQLEFHKQELDRKLSVLMQRNLEYAEISKVLAHDMQEPVRKIAILSDLLVSNYPPASGHGEVILEKIQNSVSHLRNLSNSLQRFVYFDSIVESNSLVDIQNLLQQLQSDPAIKGLSSDFELSIGNIPIIEAKPSSIKILFLELFKNAVQNRKQQVPLKINVSAIILKENSYQYHTNNYLYTDYVRIEFSDNGTGFDDTFADYIFVLFNKLDAKSKGVGLGLAICRQIVNGHFGTISASSEINKGSKFIITLPLKQPS